ncbi:unnamed protein product [Mesocestoides corti]|uniref:Uncharacterized protein n=1 Tax=Mesocestoides corti TaxID=53468 RepID=A0A3P6HKB0_MESCO|nr:unnamed protein product [Mesocestoides corti]
MVLTASRDGCIRVWQDYDGKRGMRPTLLTAWVGFESLLPLTTKSSGSSGLVTNWSDCSSHNLLLVSGDVRVVRLFDLDQEACIRDLSTNADVPVTRLARADDNLLAAGFADGTVKIFDARLPNSPMSVVFKDTGLMEAGDGGRILDLSFAPYQANRRLYAVSSSGHVGAWHLAHAASASPSNVWQPIVTLPNDSDADKPRFHMKSAILQVSLPCTRSHLVAYGMPRKLYVSRLFDGKIIAAYQPVDDILPTCAAFHPYEVSRRFLALIPRQ